MKNINILDVNDIRKANAITHFGRFHADEVMSTVLLSKIMDNVKLCRVNEAPSDVKNGVIVYDIGGGEFDHHQKGFNSCRSNGIKYSSFGLLWKKYGMKYLDNIPNKELVFELFDKHFVSGIDALDNGQVKANSDDIHVMNISGIISSFNPNWDEDEDSNICFMKAVKFANTIFDNSLKNTVSLAKAKTDIDKAIDISKDGIMVLDEFLPWQEFLLSSTNPKANDILYVIFPSKRGGYMITAVPDFLGSFGQRKSFPAEWAGLRDDALSKVSGVESASFCHTGRFLCVTKTFDDAYLLALKSVNFF